MQRGAGPLFAWRLLGGASDDLGEVVHFQGRATHQATVDVRLAEQVGKAALPVLVGPGGGPRETFAEGPAAAPAG